LSDSDDVVVGGMRAAAATSCQVETVVSIATQQR
jgi:hypothetical protein